MESEHRCRRHVRTASFRTPILVGDVETLMVCRKRGLFYSGRPLAAPGLRGPERGACARALAWNLSSTNRPHRGAWLRHRGRRAWNNILVTWRPGPTFHWNTGNVPFRVGYAVANHATIDISTVTVEFPWMARGVARHPWTARHATAGGFTGRSTHWRSTHWRADVHPRPVPGA